MSWFFTRVIYRFTRNFRPLTILRIILFYSFCWRTRGLRSIFLSKLTLALYHSLLSRSSWWTSYAPYTYYTARQSIFFIRWSWIRKDLLVMDVCFLHNLRLWRANHWLINTILLNHCWDSLDRCAVQACGWNSCCLLLILFQIILILLKVLRIKIE